jgi:hypothetical protein
MSNPAIWKGQVSGLYGRAWQMLFLFAITLAMAPGQAQGQRNTEAVPVDDEEAPKILVVIFSPGVGPSGQSQAQGVVWQSFVTGLKKKKITDLNAINELTLNENADRARVYEIARDQSRYTVWIEFITGAGRIGDASAGRDLSRLMARYTVFAPESNTIVGRGEIEQERAPEPLYSTPNNEKPIRDNSGRVVNSRPAVRLPDGSASTGAHTIDIDAYKRVGERMADRVVSSAKRHSKGK